MKPLSHASVNVVAMRRDLEFAVTVVNNGCTRETQIAVRLRVASPGQPVTGQGQIDQIDPGERKTVLIGHLALPELEKKLVLHVEVEPVPAEVSTDDNSVEYPVRFSVA
jgi:hypothetical protein